MASNGKKRAPANGMPNESLQERRRKVRALKKAVASGSYNIHTEDIVLNVLREVLQS